MHLHKPLLLATIFLLLAAQLAPAQVPASQPSAAYNVRDFGAIGDAKTKDTSAFQAALDACAVHGGGQVQVPPGNYLLGSIQIGTRTYLILDRDATLTGSPDPNDYPMMDVRWEGRWQPGRRALIYAANVDHTGIVGPGTIAGNPAVAAPQNPRGSVVLEAISCTDLRWEGFSLTQGGNWATHPTYCTDMVIKNVTIRGNRDGIDVDSCKNVRIDSCDIDTGDDCISLKSGRGLNGARIGKPTEGVVITQCTLRGRSFACLGIGSETSAGVRDVTIDNCKMAAASQAIYIKTRIGRAGITQDIFGHDLDILGGGFLRINLVSAGNTNTADVPIPGPAGYPSAKNLRFTNIRLIDASFVADVTQVASEKPVEGLYLSSIIGTSRKGITLVNVKDASLREINVTGFTGPLLATDNTTGFGLDDAVKFTPPPVAPPRGLRAPSIVPANP